MGVSGESMWAETSVKVRGPQWLLGQEERLNLSILRYLGDLDINEAISTQLLFWVETSGITY